MSEQDIYATLIEIKAEPTELYKILKFENLVSGGGEAKQVISDGYVYLNGEVETRKRKKVYAGDVIYFNEQYFQIALVGQIEQYEMGTQAPVESQRQQAPVEQTESTKVEGKKARKPISF
ncbi:RNA-binding S4 domain-containing protein [Psychromonas sp. MME2]|uniref:RNA-binding S4 domain-containing protein n=1 Tax=unclassified Psychromonas TaxID=2614957 RepID=UPI00339BC577